MYISFCFDVQWGIYLFMCISLHFQYNSDIYFPLKEAFHKVYKFSHFVLPVVLALVAGAQEPSPFTGPPYSPPDVSKSRLMVYQEVRAIRANPIFLDGVEVASLRTRWSFFVLQLSPGEHSISGRHKDNTVVLQVSPGHDYFIRIGSDLVGEKPLRASCAEVATLMDSGRLHAIDPRDVRDTARVSLATFQPACGGER